MPLFRNTHPAHPSQPMNGRNRFPGFQKRHHAILLMVLPEVFRAGFSAFEFPLDLLQCNAREGLLFDHFPF
ncbi:hypothetical protein PEDI_56800 [Persicobacter diffluens]|uniref:Uncharacterized protein n=1 Tax=Persicobacter diffluens TaxID=981 RepID=A0AAN4W599_9BACT|nr:hypothetical protein PEDI_51290 [Persicobacter diffluens]GJM65114.1 hypothetical protein PEDI_56660 [Persicobacter diffluens]GJM65128.1 hypothetical protein PEDI_56800 [Persicobacter diffluens]